MVERLTIESGLRLALDQTRVFSRVSASDGIGHAQRSSAMKRSSVGTNPSWDLCHQISSYELLKTAD